LQKKQNGKQIINIINALTGAFWSSISKFKKFAIQRVKKAKFKVFEYNSNIFVNFLICFKVADSADETHPDSNHYNTINSQKSVFSTDSHVVPFLQGQILFEDHNQRLIQV
jgi:hypothetical protein